MHDSDTQTILATVIHCLRRPYTYVLVGDGIWLMVDESFDMHVALPGGMSWRPPRASHLNRRFRRALTRDGCRGRALVAARQIAKSLRLVGWRPRDMAA